MAFSSKVVSFIDIGTNSIRTEVVRLNPNFSYSILTRQKQVVRLGQNEFLDYILISQAMERCVVVCKRFVEIGRAFGAQEFVAVATSAVREAKNQSVLLKRLSEESGLEVRVISGKEEARLIFLGVSTAFHLENRLGIFIDIGGGSTEISVGNQSDYVYLDTLKLGAIRLSELFIPVSDAGPVSSEKYSLMKKSIRSEVVLTVKRVKHFKIDIAVGTSGTVINLSEVMARYLNSGESRDTILTLAKLKKVIAMLCSLNLEERRQVPGINPERADIIIAGAAILETLMEEIGLEEIKISERGLLDGLLVDYLSQIDGFPSHQLMSVRERSVLQLGRSFNLDELHANTVVQLTLEMFDTAKERGLHHLGAEERELLEYAAFLHDIGEFINFSNHHQHSYYVIRNAELLGFDQREIEIMANLAKYHRKRLPRKRSDVLDELDEDSKGKLLMLAPFLRIAESLDSSHYGLVKHARFIDADSEQVLLELATKGDCQLEVWGVEEQSKIFRKAFDRDLILKVNPVCEPTGSRQ